MDEQYAWLYQDMEERTEAVEKLLDQPHALSGEIHRRKMKIEVLRRAVSRLEVHLQKDKVRYTPDPSGKQELLAEAIDEEQEVLRLEKEYDQAVLTAAEWIAGIFDPVAQSIMEMRYMDRMSWDEIALRTRYSRAQVFRIRRKALKELAAPGKIIPGCFTVQKTI